MGSSIIYKLLQSRYTVFNLTKAALVTGDDNPEQLGQRLRYYSRAGLLRQVRRNLFVKENYMPEELACMVFTPCYISLEYVLQREGVVFQYDNAITLVSYLRREICVDGINLSFRKIKDILLTNPDGIIFNDSYSIASPERAFLDTCYLYPDYYFDRTDTLDKDKVSSLLKIYESKALENRVMELLNI